MPTSSSPTFYNFVIQCRRLCSGSTKYRQLVTASNYLNTAHTFISDKYDSSLERKHLLQGLGHFVYKIKQPNQVKLGKPFWKAPKNPGCDLTSPEGSRQNHSGPPTGSDTHTPSRSGRCCPGYHSNLEEMGEK